VPTLILHGDSDKTVSFRNAVRIFSAASEPKHLKIFPGGDHDELGLVDPALYHSILSEFLSKYGAL
jgi:hypothetical protein